MFHRILAAFAHSPHSTVAFWHLSLSLPILARCPCHPFSRTIVFWQLLPIPSIRWSDFGSFSSPTVLMVGFWQLLLSPCILTSSLTSYSRVRSNFDSFCSHTAFDGRILAAFAFFLHSHFGNFCSLLLSHARHAPVLARDPIFAPFARTAFDGRILAASVHTLLSQWETPLIQCYIWLPTGLKLYQYFA